MAILNPRLGILLAAALAMPVGCGYVGTSAGGKDGPLRADPLPVQQAKAYPEAATGLFVSLADFENAPAGKAGHEHVKHFSIGPLGKEGLLRFVLNVTRTGAGAMEVTLAPQAELVFTIPHVHNFRGYTLLSMAVYCEGLRDDLCVTLTSDAGSWTSHRTLVRPGWNNVLIDIRRLGELKDFDIAAVRTMEIAFVDAAGPVRFNLDDVMLINNTRNIQPVPLDMQTVKTGLDYSLTAAKLEHPISISQGADGLRRLAGYPCEVQLAAPGRKLADAGENLDLMGPLRVSQVDVLEHNRVRLRLANTWYFPTRAGEWASLAIRQIRWEHTFYGDGRWVTHMELNNAGGQEIGSMKLGLGRRVALAGAGMVNDVVAGDLSGPVGRWSYLWAPADETGEVLLANYLDHGKVRLTMGTAGALAGGDEDRDGFDESQGCFFLQANQAGHCRFTILPPAKGLLNAVFKVAGKWRGKVSASSEGLSIRDVVMLDDGAALFTLPGPITRQTPVEVVGKPVEFP